MSKRIDFERLNISIPIVSAIVERLNPKGEKEILVQTRHQPENDPKYTGSLELPAGWIQHYEDVYEAIRREVEEETGLKVTKIRPDNRTKTHGPREDGAFAFEPFCCVQQTEGGLPWVGFVWICEVENGQPRSQESETRNVRWMLKKTLKLKYEREPETIFTLQLPILEKYFEKEDEED